MISIKRVSFLSALGFIAVMAIACATSGCGDNLQKEMPDAGSPDGTTVARPDAAPTPDATPDAMDPTGPSVSQDAPIVNAIPLPATTLSDFGTPMIHRMVITAPAGADALVKKLSYEVDLATAHPESFSTYVPRLRIVGSPDDLPERTNDVDWIGGGDCGFVSNASKRCVMIVLDAPLAIPAGTCVTLDFSLQIAGFFASGDTVTTTPVIDAADRQGPIHGAGIQTSIGGIMDGALWSNDGLWFYNGHSIVWNQPLAETLTR